jgi:hypothetical protein
MQDVIRGLRQALIMLTFSIIAALVGAGLWYALQGDRFQFKVAIALMVVAGLLGLTGDTSFSRAGNIDVQAFIGMSLDDKRPDAPESLTGVGIFLFVSLPLFIMGGLLLGSG